MISKTAILLAQDAANDYYKTARCHAETASHRSEDATPEVVEGWRTFASDCQRSAALASRWARELAGIEPPEVAL